MLLSKTSAARVSSFVVLSPVKRRSILSSSSFSSFCAPARPAQPDESVSSDRKIVPLNFLDWFASGNNKLLDQIFEILAASDKGLELNQLGLRLNEEFVLRVLNHRVVKHFHQKGSNHPILNHGNDVLSCVKFFDWAGRQGYRHTRATFNAIFKILSRAQESSKILEVMDRTLRRPRDNHYKDILVVGYAIAGKPDIAIRQFGIMHFMGKDLDQYSYNVLLNALVEQNCSLYVEEILKQITLRGFSNEITSCIKVKYFCKDGKLNEAIDVLHALECRGHVVNDRMISSVVDALCKKNRFELAQKLMEDFWGIQKTPLKHTYCVWIKDLVNARRLDDALEFWRKKKSVEGYVPDVFRYNTLICKLLKENRLQDVLSLLENMMDEQVSPDKLTMNAALRFFCKAGMVDVALELYNSRSKFGLYPDSLLYNYLINTLCEVGGVKEAYQVLEDSVRNGYFPGKRTSSFLANALCREGKLDMMKELVIMALDLKASASYDLCAKLISALCKASRVEDSYLIFGHFKPIDKVSKKYTYYDLIRGFNRANRGDMSAKLMIEMLDDGHRPNRGLHRAVISCFCTMDNPEQHFYRLLEMELSHQSSKQPFDRNLYNLTLYNYFIYGAGHAKRPDLAEEVFEMMGRNGIKPVNITKIYMLQSYLKNGRIFDALNFYNDLRKACKPGKLPSRQLNNVIIVGLCKANKPDYALERLKELREKNFVPSLECYEELVRAFCSVQNYDKVTEVVCELLAAERQVSSFIGNSILLHSIRSSEVFKAWCRHNFTTREETSPDIRNFGELIRLFSVDFRRHQDFDDLDEVIEHYKCFPLDTFTYNVLLRRLSMSPSLHTFFKLEYNMRVKGYQHNKWTYETIVRSLFKHGMSNVATLCMEEARRKGFELRDATHNFIN